MIALGVSGVLAESSGLPDTLGQIFREVADMPTGFLGTTQDALTCTRAPN
jgi:hypothetical protein